MPDASAILKRIRQRGANVTLDGDKLHIVNRGKLPAGAMDFIKANAKVIADFLSDEADFEERAAIIEFDGGAPRDWADQFARSLKRPAGISDLDWSWFLTSAGRIVDEAPRARAA